MTPPPCWSPCPCSDSGRRRAASRYFSVASVDRSSSRRRSAHDALLAALRSVWSAIRVPGGGNRLEARRAHCGGESMRLRSGIRSSRTESRRTSSRVMFGRGHLIALSLVLISVLSMSCSASEGPASSVSTQPESDEHAGPLVVGEGIETWWAGRVPGDVVTFNFTPVQNGGDGVIRLLSLEPMDIRGVEWVGAGMRYPPEPSPTGMMHGWDPEGLYEVEDFPDVAIRPGDTARLRIALELIASEGQVDGLRVEYEYRGEQFVAEIGQILRLEP